jgi:hypothetical protein
MRTIIPFIIRARADKKAVNRGSVRESYEKLKTISLFERIVILYHL